MDADGYVDISYKLRHCEMSQFMIGLYIFAWSLHLFVSIISGNAKASRCGNRARSTGTTLFLYPFEMSAKRLPSRTKRPPNRLKGRRHSYFTIHNHYEKVCKTCYDC